MNQITLYSSLTDCVMHD